MLLAAHTDYGWIKGSSMVLDVKESVPSADPHRNMTSSKFEYYLRVLMNCEGVQKDNCVIILDNAAYHRTFVSLTRIHFQKYVNVFISKNMLIYCSSTPQQLKLLLINR